MIFFKQLKFPIKPTNQIEFEYKCIKKVERTTIFGKKLLYLCKFYCNNVYHEMVSKSIKYVWSKNSYMQNLHQPGFHLVLNCCKILIILFVGKMQKMKNVKQRSIL